jgi:predicted RNase H-like HicB family nuclease
MSRDFTVVVTRDAEGSYVADVPELRGCHTQARSLDELQDRVREVIELCLDDEPAEAPSDLVAVQRVRVETAEAA